MITDNRTDRHTSEYTDKHTDIFEERNIKRPTYIHTEV